MLKKSLKYFIVVAINMAILTSLLALWTDKLELTFNAWARPTGFLKIIGCSLLSLLAIRILISIFRRKQLTSVSLRIKIAALITIGISSYLYIDYSKRIFTNVFVNREFRKKIAGKITESKRAQGSKGNDLTNAEYQQIVKMKAFPGVPAEASKIAFTYEYDGFLPDYLFSVEYEVPGQFKVDTIDRHDIDFSRYQSFEVIGSKKKVTYTEILR